MWNEHWCAGATRRVAEMAPRMNEVVAEARGRGVLIVHSPSSCLAAYEDHPARRRAMEAPTASDLPADIASWCRLIHDREGELPIDDSDGGCDCQPQCPHGAPWTRQIDTIEIRPEDAISDSGEEIWNLFAQRGVENVIVMGVHANMCVLGRPFGIRNLVQAGKNVVLMRDLTDTMYNPRMRPFVSHFSGNDLIVEHIERHWCPTIASTDLVGGQEFCFAEDPRPHLVMVIAEDEYDTHLTLPAFGAAELARDFRVTYVLEDEQNLYNLPGVAALGEADLALFSVRRRVLPREQMDAIRGFVASGKPLLAIRTSSHAFALRPDQPIPEGCAAWPEFDREVLGCFYQGHHGNKSEDDGRTYVWGVPSAESHPILQGVPLEEMQVPSWLYKSLPLADTATELLRGRVEERQPHEPVAWTNTTAAGGRVFYTSLGSPGDFELPAFRRLLLNATYWTAGLDAPAAVADESGAGL